MDHHKFLNFEYCKQTFKNFCNEFLKEIEKYLKNKKNCRVFLCGAVIFIGTVYRL